MISIIIFDEKRYAKRVLQSGSYQTLQYQGKERKALAKYLKHDMGYNDFEIREKVSNIKSKRKELFDDDTWKTVMDKVIEKFDNGEYIKDITIGISQTELEVILDQPTIELRNLLFVLTVYFKWARLVQDRLCMRWGETWVKEADLDCCKMAGLGRLRREERDRLFFILGRKELYRSDFINRYLNIFTLDFIDDKKPVIKIDNYEDILAHLENYINSDNCIRCQICDCLTIKKTNVQKYCMQCRSAQGHTTKLIKNENMGIESMSFPQYL